MFQLDLKSRKSIYQQVVDNLKELIISQVLSAEERLPSVRELSHTLTVNPNTVQKAYRELERQGYVYTSPGLGTFVAAREDVKITPEDLTKITNKLEKELSELYYLGVSAADVRTIVESIINQKEGWK